jgi:dephospho-CoA kinase
MGLTGSIGSGKSTVAQLLRAKGYPVLDADQLARNVIQPGTDGEAKVLEEFGKTVADDQGHIDRKKVAALVFSSPQKLQKLEGIIHPLVQAQVRQERSALASEGKTMAFYDVPLLFEKKLESQFDGVVVVHADIETCIQRVMARSSWARKEAEARIRTQLAIEQKIKRSHWVVNNNGHLSDLENEVEKLIHDIGRKFG